MAELDKLLHELLFVIQQNWNEIPKHLINTPSSCSATSILNPFNGTVIRQFTAYWKLIPGQPEIKLAFMRSDMQILILSFKNEKFILIEIPIFFDLAQTVAVMDYLVKLLDSLCPPKGGHINASSKSSTIMSLGFMNESHLVRLAGLSGALAISLGAYGAHALRESGNADERRLRSFETGNRYHLIHSVALFLANKARFPLLTISLFLGGMAVFSGSCYHYSITGKENFRKYAPIGGVMYILAWISFLF
ncbi:unnamed protein product [Cercopithifilaria johnstoni]|uniref:Uncharacterized protein n=1 Tax=Cercopithifilaria johnstoni TaxID=2874296 RepID=A0A8J2LX82_9BILA|nr:unnamed protein product [Cercopithifilaria johnstoni]